MNNTIILVGYPNNYKCTAAKNHYAYFTDARAYTRLDAANKVDALEIIRHNFPDCEVIDKAVS